MSACTIFTLDQDVCYWSIFWMFYPFPNEKYFTLPNYKSLQTTISNFMKMAESSLQWLKTLWEKEKFLVTCSVFQRLLLQTHKNQGLFGKGLTTSERHDYHKIPTYNDPEKEAFQKYCGKRKKCWFPAFSPFPTRFSTLFNSNFIFWVPFILSSANAFNLNQSGIVLFGKELYKMDFMDQ